MDINNMLVLDTDRNIDVEASVAKFRASVTRAAEVRKNDLEVVSKGVHALFDQFPGAHIQIDAIKSMVCSALNVHHSAFGDVGDRIHKFVQDNTEAGNGITKDGLPAVFVMRKGKGGGFARRADLKAQAPSA